MQSMIIHLTRASHRRANVDRLLAILPNAQIIEAETGTGRTSLPGNLLRPPYPFAIGGGEMGCLASHQKCWQNLIESGAEYALIVEDDLGIEPEAWADAQALIARHMSADHFIRLPAKARETAAQTLDREGKSTLFLPRVIGLQTVAQVVGRNAARRLLDASVQQDRPVDTFLQMHWVHGQPIHTILPNGVHEQTADLGGSTIQRKVKTGKLMREIRRWRYRRAVAKRPQIPRV